MMQQQTSKVVDFGALRHACSTCSLSELCVAMGLDKAGMEQLDSVVEQSGPLHAEEHLFRVGDRFRAVYAVRSGCLKTYTVDSLGREQVLGFHLPGELVGLDAIYPNRHRCNGVSLDTSSVCVLPYAELNRLAHEIPSLQQQIFRLMSKDIANSSMLSGDYTAEERLASFLLGMSQRLRRRGYSETDFNLAMSRRDIANYLRLATETVSRVFKRFQLDGLIKVERRAIQILDMERLKEMASCIGAFDA